MVESVTQLGDLEKLASQPGAAMVRNTQTGAGSIVFPGGGELPLAGRVVDQIPGSSKFERVAVQGAIELWRVRSLTHFGPADDAELLDLYHNAPPGTRLLLTVLLRTGSWRG